MKVGCEECGNKVDKAPYRKARFCSGRCRTIYFNKRRPRGERHSNRSADEPTEVPTMLDIAWAAGVYEGEGHICKPRDSYKQRIAVTQKDLWLLSRLKIVVRWQCVLAH